MAAKDGRAKNLPLMRAARKLTVSTRTAGEKAKHTGRAADKDKAEKLATQNVEKIQTANRAHFERLSAHHVSTAIAAMDRLSALFERRKYRVLPEDASRIVDPISATFDDMMGAFRVALARKRLSPSVGELMNCPMPPVEKRF